MARYDLEPIHGVLMMRSAYLKIADRGAIVEEPVVCYSATFPLPARGEREQPNLTARFRSRFADGAPALSDLAAKPK